MVNGKVFLPAVSGCLPVLAGRRPIACFRGRTAGVVLHHKGIFYLYAKKSAYMNPSVFPGTPRWQKKARAATITSGAFLVACGLLLLLSKIYAGIPAWLVSWPMLLIGIGLLFAVLSGFRHFFWLPVLLAGVFFLLQQQMPQWQLQQFTLPFIVMLIGLRLMFRRPHVHPFAQEIWWSAGTTQDNWLDSTVVLGSVKKQVFPTDFRGGDITCLLGSVDVDLGRARLQGVARLDITLVCGHAQLALPRDWVVQSDITGIFGGVQDKRSTPLYTAAAGNILVLDGTAFFSHLEIVDAIPAV